MINKLFISQTVVTEKGLVKNVQMNMMDTRSWSAKNEKVDSLHAPAIKFIELRQQFNLFLIILQILRFL